MQVDKAVEENRGEGKKTRTSNKDGSYSAIRWERFLPRMVIRVLLVEADDSTRHIISALLRKCSYKVAAVPDGLKAWEVLKGRPHNIDIILTEVELPSISGFALLTLVMEHEICKKIPVIMMSSQDSVSTVYKCMLRGAADFLVKPVRINELRNVWQHVWRRQSQSGVGASGPQGESVARQEVEATAENNAAASASNRPGGGSKALMGNKEGSGDDQTSCTKPDMEAESAYVKENENQSQLDSSGKLLVYGPKLKERGSNCDSLGQNFIQQRENVDAEENLAKNGNKMVQHEAIRLESNGEVANMCAGVCHEGDDVLANPAKEAIDLIGTFGNHVRCSHGDSSSNPEANKPEFPHLDLSLRRFHIAAVESPEKQTWNPSIGSAFSRYVSKNPQLLHPSPVSVCGSRDDKMNSGNNHMSDDVQKFKSSDKAEAASSYHGNTNSVSAPICPADQRAEVSHAHTRQNVFHVPFPVRGTSLDGLYAGGYGSFIPPSGILCASSAKQNTTDQLDPCTEMNQLGHLKGERNNNPEQQNYHNPLDHRTFSSNSNSKQKTSNNLEIQLEERTRFSSACTDQSASSSFCNNNNNYYNNNGGGVSHRNSFGGCGSVCASNNSNNLNSSGVGTAGMRVASESGNEDIIHAAFPTDANYLRSIQREAALTKFRLKRKERCFDKKVRYESRKKLAEQRPRVKGQFVRQVFPDLPPAGAEMFLS